MGKMVVFVHSLALVLILCPVYGDDTKPAETPITEAEAVLAIYVQNDGLAGDPNSEPFNIIQVIWGDGRIVWSQDRLHGGAPYFAAEIAPEKVRSLLSNLKRDGFFAEPGFKRAYFGPDAAYTSILVRFGKEETEMRTWHELAESSGKLVSDNGSLTGLGSGQLYQTLKKNKPEYLLFRMTWNEIRARAAELIPSSGTPAKGVFKEKHGILSWQADSAAKKEK